MALNCTSLLQAFVPQWETRGNDITPPGWTGQALMGTSMFSKVALMLSSCLKRPVFGEWGQFLFGVYASALPSCPQTPPLKHSSPKPSHSIRSHSEVSNLQSAPLLSNHIHSKISLIQFQISTFLKQIRRPKTFLNHIYQLPTTFPLQDLAPRAVLSDCLR